MRSHIKRAETGHNSFSSGFDQSERVTPKNGNKRSKSIALKHFKESKKVGLTDCGTQIVYLCMQLKMVYDNNQIPGYLFVNSREENYNPLIIVPLIS